MVAYADALLGVNEYPHRDAYERGVEALRLAARIARGEVRPVMHLARLPMLLPAATTDEGPAHEVNRLCAAWEACPGLLDCTFFHGFPYCDIPDVGVAVLATADGDPELARAAAEDVASRIWAMREAFRHEPTPPDAAIRLALATAGRPVVINEKSDNPGGGAPGDGTHLLRAMLEAGLTDACFGYIVDPETAAAAHAAGVGVELDVRLGGKTYELHGAPIEARAYVKCLTDGRFRRTSPMGRGAAVDLGPMARLQLPTRGGVVDVIVGSRRQQTLDPELFLLHGIDVTRYKIVALKSSQHFRAGFADLAARIIRADTPGMTGTDYAIFPYRRIRRPIWPLDPDATPAAAAGEGRGG
jgi:microcystin degradation protein MlrC